MCNLKIEKNIPLPGKTTKCRILGPKYPFSEMMIGDSFFLPLRNISTSKDEHDRNLANYFLLKKLQVRLCSSAKNFRKNNNKFAYRTEMQKSPLGVRIWRIKTKNGNHRSSK